MNSTATQEKTSCYHCGEDCPSVPLIREEKKFCCEGCRTVYDILSQNGMCEYYRYNETPGNNRKSPDRQRYDFLDDEEVASRFITYKDDNQTHVNFYIPGMHCSSCIWLLENLNKLHPGILRSRVNFITKELSLQFSTNLKLPEIASLLDRVGYPPHLSMDSLSEQKVKSSYFDKRYFYKLGIAFFSFGNIMLLSFPEYFGIDAITESPYRSLFGYLNFVLALPVMFYSASEFFVSAWKGVRIRSLNMDFPIALGILVMFIRSSWEIFSGTGGGYMDTLASLVFLMLVGRSLQNMTYGRLSFDRDYKSYFPVSVTRLFEGKEKGIPVNKVETGFRLLIRNNELIPADAILFKGDAHIDYSFVTGESTPVEKTLGEIIFAGGKQIGNPIEVEVVREVSQSYLTRLWNEDVFNTDKSEHERLNNLSNRISKWFTLVILLIATGAALYWFREDSSRAMHAFASVLIITCPCALALSTPFTLGNTMRIMGKWNFYLRSTDVIEKLAKVDTILFDKTGTLTQAGKAQLEYKGEPLDQNTLELISTATRNSTHPLSRSISEHLDEFHNEIKLDSFQEIAGKGIIASYKSKEVKIGSASWILNGEPQKEDIRSTEVYISVNGTPKGKFIIMNEFRPGLEHVINDLKQENEIVLVSGDNDSDLERLLPFFGNKAEMHFRYSPFQKLELVKEKQAEQKNVLMIGDGLNDAGALRQSDVGISVSEDINNFSPACDAILDSDRFTMLPSLLKFAKIAVVIILISFGLSFLYNIVGLWFAVQGNLSPLVAAILMPLSSISVILFTTGATALMAKRTLNNKG
ncbi:MAG TPA: heavy metal translocating P-type ATPase metal-binding domain-containing protein [Flavobacteriales bacterium]|nr:heavy metal translocating P-type ATPase metal-binding domain-containing protein [Flavobacteriales bacterium]HRJ35973.1 heavy metal translocating P-type ATPase metal-binding domain-containing protein [Flavobacteriales bacterium]HRJ39793.1 heavy metal translocating P-type ATPase metal-binding domain-containing protein [Flavobacteriales bacterium]